MRRYASCADLTFTWPGKAVPVDELIAKKTAAKKAPKKKAPKKAAKKAVAKDASSVETWTERVVKDLMDHPKARPAKKKTLLTKVADLIKKPVGGPEVQSVIERMQSEGTLKFDEKDVPEYNL